MPSWGRRNCRLRRAGTAAELRQLYVLGDWHGRGVAQALMEWVIDRGARAAAPSNSICRCSSTMHRARRFYERYGFEEEGRYAFMVGTHADEDIVMRLAL